MKRFAMPLITALFGATMLQGCILVTEEVFPYGCFALEGYRVSDVRYTPDFWGVQVYDNLPVVVAYSYSPYVEVNADAGVQPFIHAEVAPDGVLEVWYDGPSCALMGVDEIYVSGPGLELFPTQPTPRIATTDSIRSPGR